MIRTHLDTLHVSRLWIDQVPGFAAVAASPQAVGLRIHYFPILRVEHKESNDASEVEHSPGLRSIVADVSAGHIAAHQNRIGVQRADRRVKHCAASSWTHNRKVSGSL